MDSLAALWPPFGLRIEVAGAGRRIELRGMTDADIALIADVTPEDVYGPEIPEHAFPWIFSAPPDRARNSAQYRWLNRATFQPATWSLDMAVYDGTELIGVADLRATEFASRRAVATGSWNLYRHQGQGYGTLVRHGIAAFCFEHLGAERIESGWMLSNAASARVSAKLGYQKTEDTKLPAGPESKLIPGTLAVLTRERYRAGYEDAPAVTVTGCTENLLALMGAGG